MHRFNKPILLVDDSEDDLMLMKLACERSGLPHSLRIVRDGMEAVAYLAGDGKFSDRRQYPSPAVVFMDIHMPKMDGLEALQWIRAQPQLFDLPVVMLTTSNAASDMERAYRLGVTSYLRKGEDMVEFAQAMRVILKYWLELNVSHRY